jgi:cytochrome c oxidase subunit IV
MEFNDSFPNYEVLAQHDNEAGIGVRKHLWQVFWLLFAVTIIELFVGWAWGNFDLIHKMSKTYLIIFFITFTLVKAGYIVMAFMHLGDENKWMRWMVLGPYCIFIVYLIYMVTVTEGTYCGQKGHKDDVGNILMPVTHEAPSSEEHHE